MRGMSRVNRGMGRTRLIKCCALCSVALACHTKAPEAALVSAPPRAAEAEVENEPSAPATSDAIPTADPSGLPRKPRVTVQTVVAESGGGIEPQAFTRIIQQRIPEMRDCYVRRLERRPGLEGQLHFRLQLASNADVTNAEAVVHTLDDAEAVSCVKAIMLTLVLPAPEPAAVFVVPLTFAP